jgi:hypothetical protein
MNALEIARRSQALKELYDAESFPSQMPSTDQWWMSPFALAEVNEGFERQCERVVLAASRWLQNPDLRPHRQLIVSHTEVVWSLIYQRAELPEEEDIARGPFAVTLLNEHHKVIPGTRFRYHESMTSAGRRST